jgi:hypothetical protein
MRSARFHAPGLLWFVPSALTEAAVVAALVAGALPAQADSAPADPVDPATPPTVTADALPTVQIDGVGLTQLVVGTTVYVGGTFTTARPAGAAAGVGTKPRSNVLAYDLLTGKLKSFQPKVNGTVQAIAASADGKRIYLGGSFTRVNGVRASHVVALGPRGGVRTTFKAGTDKTVRSLALYRDALWLGGDFSTANGKLRGELARLNALTGKLHSWAPRATDGQVAALLLSPDKKSIVVGGRFTRLNGSSKPGYGIGRLSSSTGKMLSFPVGRRVRNAGPSAGITSLSSDGTNLYGGGFVYANKGGNLEGSFAARWSDGKLVWLNSCHGDTYDVFPLGKALYTVGHAHTCETIGGFPEKTPKEYYYALAFSKAVTGTNKAESDPLSRFPDFEGLPAPSLLTWTPLFDVGNTTEAGQAGWSVVGRGRYLAIAGEFKHVNGAPQQGLVRFVTRDRAPNLVKPMLAGWATPVAARSGNQVTVTWDTTWDRDNRDLTYQVLRRLIGSNADYAPISTPETRASDFWDRQQMSFSDENPESGTYRYQVLVTDPLGNTRLSQVTEPVTVP